MSTILTVTIPTVIIGYGIYLVIHLLRNRKNGCGCGCSGCPMNGNCHVQPKGSKKTQKD